MEGYAMASPTSNKMGPVWAVNILTVGYKVYHDSSKVLEQIYFLSNMSVYYNVPVNFIEFGNEIFISSHYSAFYHNATEYVTAVRDGVALARRLLPHAKLAAPVGYRFCSPPEDKFDDFDVDLANYVSMFDGEKQTSVEIEPFQSAAFATR
eukprot:715734-Prymnesium_polylepis.2